MTFQPHIYKIFNPDVKNLPLYQLKSHWFTIGIHENRISSIETFMQKYPNFNLIEFRKLHPEMNHSDIADCLYKYYSENSENKIDSFKEEIPNDNEMIVSNIFDTEMIVSNIFDTEKNIINENESDNIDTNNIYSENVNTENLIIHNLNINDYVKKWIDLYEDKNVLGICLDSEKSCFFDEFLIAEVLNYFDYPEELVIYFFLIKQNSLDEMEKKLFPLVKKNLKYELINNFIDSSEEGTNDLFMLLCDYLIIDSTTINHINWNDSNAKQIFLHKTCLSPINDYMFKNKNITLLNGYLNLNISNRISSNKENPKNSLTNKNPKGVYNILIVQKININDNDTYSLLSIINQKNIFIDILFICSNDIDKNSSELKNLLSDYPILNNIYWIDNNDKSDFDNFFLNYEYDYYFYSENIHFQTPYTLQKMIEYFSNKKVFIESEREIITYEEHKPKKSSRTKSSNKSEKEPKKIVKTIKENCCLENQFITLDKSLENIFLTDDKNFFVDLLNNKIDSQKLNPIYYPYNNDFLKYPCISLKEINDNEENLFYESEFDWFKLNVELYVINLKTRKDRLQSFKEECNKIGIEEENIVVYNAIRPTVEQAFNCSFIDLNECWECKRRDIQYFIGASGCKMSHYESLKKFLEESDKKYLMLCEDDAFFEDRTVQRIYQSIQSLEDIDEDWDILYIGTHLLHKEDAEWTNEFLLRVKHGLTTTAQIFPRRKISEIIKKIEQSKKEIDNTYSELLDKKYCVYPMSVCQKKFRSDIVHHMCDYGDYHRKFNYN